MNATLRKGQSGNHTLRRQDGFFSAGLAMLLSAVFLTVGATVDGTDASEEEMRLAEQTQQTTREVVVRDGGRFNKS